jgi:hypothetical protein
MTQGRRRSIGASISSLFARKRMSMVSKNTENNTGVGGAGLMRAGKQSRLTIGNPKDLRKCKGE